MKKFACVLKAAAGAFALVCAACASTQPSESDGIKLYVDPETGRYSADEDASDDAKAIADLMNMFSTEQEADVELTDAEIWRTDEVGNMTHIQSGLICPANWSGFARQDSQIYKRSGQDVGCTYVSGNSIVSFYAYRNGGTVAEEVKGVMDQIVKARHPVNSPSSIAVLETFAQRGEFAIGTISYKDAHDEAMKSGVLINQIAGWRLKIRYTFPVSDAQRTEGLIVASLMGQQDSLLSAAPDVAAETDDTI